MVYASAALTSKLALWLVFTGVACSQELGTPAQTGAGGSLPTAGSPSSMQIGGQGIAGASPAPNTAGAATAGMTGLGGSPAVGGTASGATGGAPVTTGGAGQGPYIASANGYIVMDAESEPLGPTPVTDWAKLTSHLGFSGSSYYEWTGPDSFGSPGGVNTVLSYRFRVSVAGTYQIHLHLHQPVNAVWDAGNDIFLRVPKAGVATGGADLSAWLKVYVGSLRDDELATREERMVERSRPEVLSAWRWWVWSEEPRSFLRAELQPGVHTIEITGRSKGLAFDRIVVFRREETSPKQPSVDESLKWVMWPESPREP